MPVSFPLLPTSGQVYEFSFNAWMYTGTFWRAINASGSVTSGNLGNAVLFSGNVPSGSIGANHLASGVGGGSALSLSSGTVTSGFIGDNAVTSGNIASGQIGQYQINDFSLGLLNNTRGGDFGYFAGGNTSTPTPSFTTRTDKITYSNDTSAAQTSANLSQARIALAGISEGFIKGYFAGGSTQTGSTSSVATAERLTYSTNNTNAQTSANLSQARNYLAGVSGERTKGYFAGGNNNSNQFTVTADKLVYSTDTTGAQTSANLSQDRSQLAGISEGSQKGYFAGGYAYTNTYVAVATAEKLTYSNDTTSAQTSANLSQARRFLAGCSGDVTKGYFAGGFTGLGVAVSTADKIIYSTDTTSSQSSANLSQARIALAGISQGLAKGYFAGGFTQTSVPVATADKLTYPNDTTAAQTSANLGQASDSLAGVSQEYTSVFGNNCVFSGNISSSEIGRYHLGEYPSSGQVQSGDFGDNSIFSGNIASGQIGRIHFMDGHLSIFGYSNTGISAKGYFVGGTTSTIGAVATTEHMNYTAEVSAALTTTTLSQARGYGASISGESNKGYCAGGSNQQATNAVSTVDKITFITDAFSTNASLSQVECSNAGLTNYTTAGYSCCGFSTSSFDSAVVNKINYSTDARTTITTASFPAKGGVSGVSGEGTKGYVCGGSISGVYQNSIEIFTYSTETSSASTSTLGDTVYQSTGLSNSTSKGYVLGGLTSTLTVINKIYKITYSTDSSSAITSYTLISNKWGASAVSNNNTKGYVAGGLTTQSYSSSVNTAQSIVYSNDSSATVTSANLSQARGGAIGIDGGPTSIFSYNSVFSGNISSSSFDWTSFVSGTFASGGGLTTFTSGSISSGMFGDSSVVSGSVASGQLFRFHLSDNSVYSDAVRSGNVSAFKFAAGAVVSGDISDGGAIATTNLASGGVQSGAFGDSMIASGDILSGRIAATNFSSGALLTRHISSGAITGSQLASGQAVGAFKLASGIVVSGNIASGTIFFTPFIDGAIESGNIASGVIGLFHPANSSVTSGAIPSGTVIFNMVGANATVANNFADAALASSNFALQSVTGDNLAAGVWPQPTAFFVSGGIIAFMFNNNSVVNGSFAPNTFTPAGYFAGGQSAGTTAAITQKLVYDTEIMFLLATSDLSTARQELTGCSGDGKKGYFAGGTSSTGSLNFNIVDIMFYYIDKPYFSNTAVLTQGRYGLASVTNNATKGYFVGGTTGNSSCLTTAEVVTYSNDIVSSQTTANLPVGTSYLIGCSGDNTKGYFCGGETTSASNPTVTTTYKITYSTESTISQTTANLSQAREYSAGLTEGTTKGYILGGMSTNFFNTPVNTVDLIVYSTDSTSAKTSAQLSTARGKCGAISDRSTKGFIAGGETNLLQYVNITDKLTYATDITVSQTSSNFATSVARYASVDGGNSPLTSVVVTSGKLTTTAANEITFRNMASGSIVSGSIVSGVVFSDATTNNFSNASVRSGNIQSGEIGRVHFSDGSIISGNIGSGVIRFPEFFGDTAQYFVINSGQIDQYHLNWSLINGSPTKAGFIHIAAFKLNKLVYVTDISFDSGKSLIQGAAATGSVSDGATTGYFAGGSTGGLPYIVAADKIVYSNEVVSAQTTANLSQGRYYLGSCSGEGTKGYFAGGQTASNIFTTTADKLTYSTEITAAQTTANLSQARTPVGISEGSTKGYFAGGLTSSTGRVITADKLTFSNDTTAAQTTANLSLGRDSLAGCSGEGSKGYFAGGISGTTLGGVYVTTTDKLTYSNDNTSAQTTADLSQPRQNLAGISEGSTKGYFVGGILAGSNNYSSVADKLTYSNDTTSAQASAYMYVSRQSDGAVDGGLAQNNPPANRLSDAYLTSSKLASGTISLTTASGQNASFPYNFAETANINTNQPMFDYFRAGELISGIKAVCIGSGNLVRRAERASGLRLPAIGCTSGAILSGTTGRVYYYGYLGRTQSGQVASGFQGQPLYVGSGGFIVNRSGFMGGASSGAPFLSGDMQQLIGVAMSGGLFVMPSPMMIRSGFQGTLPYNMR